eukprot:3023477-Pleurochrysis_carterae.AAC.2
MKGEPEPKRLVETLHSYNAGEFLSITRLTDFQSKTGVHTSICPPHVHELNGVAERAICSIMGLARANLVAASAPTLYWDYAVQHAVMSSIALLHPQAARRSPSSWKPGTSPPSWAVCRSGARPSL